MIAPSLEDFILVNCSRQSVSQFEFALVTSNPVSEEMFQFNSSNIFCCSHFFFYFSFTIYAKIKLRLLHLILLKIPICTNIVNTILTM